VVYARNEAPKVPRGMGFYGKSVRLPSRLGGLGERRELPLQGPPTHSRHISGPQMPLSRNNALYAAVYGVYGIVKYEKLLAFKKAPPSGGSSWG